MRTGNEKSLSSKQKKILAVFSFAAFLIFTVIICIYVGQPMIKFVSEPQKFRSWVDSHGIWSRVAFVGMVVFQVVIAIIPGEPLEIGAGYAFGAVEGTTLCVIGLTLGSLIIFALVRTIGIRAVEVFFSVEKIRSLKFLRDTKKLNLITFIIFAIPGTPKDFISYFVGLTDIKLPFWIFIASVARLPSVITSTIGGSALGVKEYKVAIIVFSTTLIVSVLGIIIYRIICRIHSEKSNKT